jgi:RNA polymerase sigma factor (sigma-70 family)
MSKPEPSLDLDALLAEADWFRPLARSLAEKAEVEPEDLLQDTLETALRHSPGQADKLRPWLRRVMLNLGGMRLRAESRRHAREGMSAGPTEPLGAEILVERAEQRRLIAEAVVRVKEPYRRTLLWHYFEDWSTAKIARHEKITTSTVRGRLKRGLDLIRVDLAQRWGKDWRNHCLALAGSRTGLYASAKVAILAAAGLLVIAGISKSYFYPEDLFSGDAHPEIVATAAASPLEPPQPLILPENPVNQTEEIQTRVEIKTVSKEFPKSPYETILIRAIDALTGEVVPDARVRLMTSEENLSREPEYRYPGKDDFFARAPANLEIEGLTNDHGEFTVHADSQDQFVLVDSARGRGTLSDLRVHPPNTVERSPIHRSVEVKVWPVLNIEVEVRTHDGRPAADAPIALCIAPPGPDELGPIDRLHGRILSTARADQDGLAQLQVNGEDLVRLRQRLKQAGFSLRLEVRLRYPDGFGDAVPVPLGLDHWRSRATLQLPRLGRLEVHTLGSIPDLFALLGNKIDAGHPHPDFQGKAPRVEGIAQGQNLIIFPYLPLDESFSLLMTRAKNAVLGSNFIRVLQISGPTASEPVRRLEIDNAKGAWLRGKMVMPDQSPAPFTFLRIRPLDINLKRTGTTYWIHLEADGSFDINLKYLEETYALWNRGRPSQQKSSSKTKFLHFIPDLKSAWSVPRRGVVFPGESLVEVPDDYRTTGVDLGKIVLGSAPLITEGQVVDAEGNPAADCRVTLYEEYQVFNDPKLQRNWTQSTQRTRTDLNGHFRFAAVLRDSGTGNFRLQARMDYGLNAYAEVKQGDKDVLMQLPQSGQLHFGYRWAPGDIYVSASLRPVNWSGWENWEQSKYDSNSLRPVGLSYLRWWVQEPNKLHHRVVESIPVGEYEFGLTYVDSIGNTQQEVMVCRVHIRSDKIAAPPLLQDIDLLSFIRGYRFDLVDELGDQLSQNTGDVSLLAGLPPTTGLIRGGNSKSLSYQNGSWLLFEQAASRLGLDANSEYAILSVNGFLPVALKEPLNDQRVVLQRQPNFTITVEGAPARTKEITWKLELTWLDHPVELRQYTRRNLKWVNHRTKVQLPGYGRYRLNWYVYGQDKELLGSHQEITRFPASEKSHEYTLVFPDASLKSEPR